VVETLKWQALAGSVNCRHKLNRRLYNVNYNSNKWQGDKPMPLEKTSTTQDDPANIFKQKSDYDIDNQFSNLPQQVISGAGKKVDKEAIKRRLAAEQAKGGQNAPSWQ
jgi:hypothetical protein